MHTLRVLLCVALLVVARVSAEETNDLIEEAAAPPTPLDQEPNDYPAHLMTSQAADVASGATEEQLSKPVFLQDDEKAGSVDDATTKAIAAAMKMVMTQAKNNAATSNNNNNNNPDNGAWKAQQQEMNQMAQQYEDKLTEGMDKETERAERDENKKPTRMEQMYEKLLNFPQDSGLDPKALKMPKRREAEPQSGGTMYDPTQDSALHDDPKEKNGKRAVEGYIEKLYSNPHDENVLTVNRNRVKRVRIMPSKGNDDYIRDEEEEVKKDNEHLRKRSLEGRAKRTQEGYIKRREKTIKEMTLEQSKKQFDDDMRRRNEQTQKLNQFESIREMEENRKEKMEMTNKHTVQMDTVHTSEMNEKRLSQMKENTQKTYSESTIKTARLLYDVNIGKHGE